MSGSIAKVITNYTYDTLGNLALETIKNKRVDYEYNSAIEIIDSPFPLGADNGTTNYSIRLNPFGNAAMDIPGSAATDEDLNVEAYFAQMGCIILPMQKAGDQYAVYDNGLDDLQNECSETKNGGRFRIWTSYSPMKEGAGLLRLSWEPRQYFH